MIKLVMHRMTSFGVLSILLWPALVLADPLRGDVPGSKSTGSVPLWVPDIIRHLMRELIDIQRVMIGDLQHAIGLVRNGGSVRAALMVVGIGLIYGIVHAIGPGHGKIVVASYLGSRQARFAHALRISWVMSALQAGSAIALISVLYFVLHLGGRALLADGALFETVSFGLIGLFGLVVAWRAAWGRKGCGHGSICGHDHEHNHGDVVPRGEILMGSVAVGLRPCTGSLLILLFTFANGLPWLGIAATLAMAAGSAVTVALVGIGAVGTRLVVVRVAGDGPLALWLGRAVAVAAGGVIAVTGFTMLAASLMLGPMG
ncbi:MAG: hypothetical protein HQL37_08855 [Alphaproteobacteria bacterium]|nr:hypothetical protein [Alphaproteobacteria bacterium]